MAFITAFWPYLIFITLLTFLLSYRRIGSQFFVNGALILSCAIELVVYRGTQSDWATYMGYVATATHPGSTYFEPAFDFLCFIANSTFGFYVIPIFACVMILVSLTRYWRFFGDNVTEYFVFCFSVLSAFLPLFYGALRQAIAFSLLLIAIEYVFRQKWIRSILWAAAAFCFHRSSALIVALLITALAGSKFLKRKWILVVITIALFGILHFVVQAYLAGALRYLEYSGENYVLTEGRGLKSLLLPIERIIFMLMAVELAYSPHSGRWRKILFFVSFVGGFFYLLIYPFALNLAGRTLAFFRLADIYILCSWTDTAVHSRSLSCQKIKPLAMGIGDIPIVACCFYIVVKFYFTIASTGMY